MSKESPVRDDRVGASPYWAPLWRHYRRAPSIVLCRVPELEYAATLPLAGAVLDHCCGDGRFAALAWPGRMLDTGCDVDSKAIERARRRGGYRRTDVCDAAGGLPYPNGAFRWVFNNSALEHIPDVARALAEVARVLEPGGTFAFSVLNHRYFEWWPLDRESLAGYRAWQPFHHAWPLADWTRALQQAGLRVADVQGYFSRPAAQELARLDCEFSGRYLARRPSRLASWYLRLPFIFSWYWRRRLADLPWKTAADEGAGYFIQALRA